MANCPETFYWFPPGVYYFDFMDYGLTNTPEDYWREPVEYLQVVGGTPKGWNPCSTYNGP